VVALVAKILTVILTKLQTSDKVEKFFIALERINKITNHATVAVSGIIKARGDRIIDANEAKQIAADIQRIVDGVRG
jgi:hypothetical protein